MRTAAALLITAAGILAGLLLRDRLRRKLRVADALCRMCAEIGGRMLYLCEPLPAITEALSRNETYADLPFLGVCAEQCRNGAAFPSAWRTAAEQFIRAQRISADRVPLVSLGPALTAADARQIEQLLTLYGEQFGSLRQSAQESLDHNGKLALTVCAGAGVLLGILLL